MRVRAAAVLVGSTVLVAAAAAAGGGSPAGVTMGGPFVLAKGAPAYAVIPKAAKKGPPIGPTRVEAWRHGRMLRAATLRGGWGIPSVGADGSLGGLSYDHRTLVLASVLFPRFIVLDARTLAVRRRITLRGSWSFDALSPDARTLYLIQHVASRFSSRYYVRAYDLVHGKLLKKIVFDTRERWGLMSGSPLTRVVGTGGRWVYTLYTRPGGRPFVHALDSVKRRAVCVDLPWHGSQAPLRRAKLRLRGHALIVARSLGRPFATVDLRTYRVTA